MRLLFVRFPVSFLADEPTSVYGSEELAKN